jgi:putative ABC transport system permease protein
VSLAALGLGPEFRARFAFAIRLARKQTIGRARRGIAAFLGVAGGIVLVMVQLGFQSALYESAVRLHHALDGEVVLVSPEFQSIQGLTWIPRATLERAAGHPAVTEAHPLFLSQLMVRNVDDRRFSIILGIGIDPDSPAIPTARLGPAAASLRLPDRVLFDDIGQPLYGDVLGRLAREGEVELVTATAQRSLQRAFVVAGRFSMGATIVFPGSMVASETTLLDAIGQSKERVNVGVLRLVDGTDPDAVARDLRGALGGEADVETKASFIARERDFWSKETPIGILFDMGAVIGFLISAVFVYQVLFQSIDESIAEYALLKTLGYRRWFFAIVVLATAALIVLAAFPLALALSALVYWICGSATQLPVEMTAGRVLSVALFALAVSAVSALLAVRRLGRADPAALL